uniref:EXPERA domain-containing protein n=1 Tax=Ananas comosus var. bracteatus TaxID=296719 RepID=A0A6V7P0E7_ANACO|nr:unnamed protein product [Ananas comosus var. bracteatus]
MNACSLAGILIPLVGLDWIEFRALFDDNKDRSLAHVLVGFYGAYSHYSRGYFAFTPEFYKEKTPHYLAEVWKEYSKSDSRYVSRDAAVVTAEGITAAIEGPACLLAVFAIASRKSYSYILQFAICLGQLYGCLVYFITAYLDGDNFSISPFYYWAYYIGANSPWVVIPNLIAIRSWKKICAAFQAEKKMKTR